MDCLQDSLQCGPVNVQDGMPETVQISNKLLNFIANTTKMKLAVGRHKFCRGKNPKWQIPVRLILTTTIYYSNYRSIGQTDKVFVLARETGVQPQVES